MPDSSINTGLQSIPDLSGVQDTKTAYHIMMLYNAAGILQQAIDAYTGNTPNSALVNNYDGSDPGAALISTSKGYWTAGVAITAGYAVHVNAAKQVVLADINSGLLAHGIATQTVAAGAVCETIILGLMTYVANTLTPGATYYLGAGGQLVTAASGQPIGFAISDSQLWVNPSLVNTTPATPTV